MTRAEQRAESLIAELGISQPVELDIEAIAYYSGIEVIYEPLKGCEASLVGYVNYAIATINPCNVRGRERFSIAHEIGHWFLHRGRSFQCRVEEPDKNVASNRDLEKEADRFAAHLLMPKILFNPLVRQAGRPTFQNLAEIAVQFDTSLMATALRLANVNTLPVIVACYDKSGFRWSLPSADIPRRWFLKKKLDEETFTYDLLNNGTACPRLSKQPADAWFENSDAEEYEVWEQCIYSHEKQALVLLYLETSMIEIETNRENPHIGRDVFPSFGRQKN